MVEYERSDLSFDRTTGFSFSKSSLPPKIIQLRRISQENHVRRIKLAYQRKEMQGLMDISSCLSTYFPRRNDSNSKTTLTTPKSVRSCTDAKQSRRKEKFDLLPAKAKSDFTSKVKFSDSSKRNHANKSVDLTKIKNTSSPNKKITSLNFSKIGNCHHTLTKKTCMIEKGDWLDNNLQNMCISKEEKVPSPDYKDETGGRGDELVGRKTPIAVKEEKDIVSDKNNQNLVAKKKPSKIPIFKGRLKTKDNSKENYCHRLENCNEVTDKSLESLLIDAASSMIADIGELNLKQATEKQEAAHIKENCSVSSRRCRCCRDDSYQNTYETFCEEEESRDERSLIKWMNGVLDTGDNEKNSSESLITKLQNMTITSHSHDENLLCSPRKENTPERLDFTKGSEISCKYDYITDLTESEGSPELYYEIEEVGDEASNSKDLIDFNKWKDANFEADSTITVPSDKDLELADHRDPVYKNLPDYPNTPYNLRYPRYKFRSYNNIFNSIKMESADSSNKLKTPKGRRKSYSATPKRIRSGKKRRTKKQISRKKEA